MEQIVYGTGWMRNCRESLEFGDVVSNILPGDVVIVINYFGHYTYRPYAELNSAGAIVVEDCSQSLYTLMTDNKFDCRIYSLRKFLGVQDGGLLISRRNLLPDTKLGSSSPEWRESARQCILLRKRFDEREENDWYKHFRKVEENAPPGMYRVDSLTKELFVSSRMHHEKIALQRRENYIAMQSILKKFSLLDDLVGQEVPLGFPAITDKRDSMLNGLYTQKIYPPVHWRIKHVAPEKFVESHLLSSKIMTLPCNQRYKPDDMLRVTNHFLNQHMQ